MMAGVASLADHVPRALAALRHLFPDGPAGFNLVDFAAPSVQLWTDPSGATQPDAGDIVARCAADHPVLVHVGRTRDQSVLQLADFPAFEEMKGTELWAGVFEPAGVDQQMVAPFSVVGFEVGLTVQRAGRPYDGRERALLRAARPGFVAAFTAAVASDRLNVLDGALAESGCGFVVIDRHGEITAVGGWATEGLGGWPSPVSREVAAWACSPSGRRPPVMMLDGQRPARLRWRGSTRQGALIEVVDVLAGDRYEGLGLTIREAQVLSVLDTGLTAREAADTLGISVATLHKHLEHAYRRLGVRNLRAALARVAQEP